METNQHEPGEYKVILTNKERVINITLIVYEAFTTDRVKTAMFKKFHQLRNRNINDYQIQLRSTYE